MPRILPPQRVCAKIAVVIRESRFFNWTRRSVLAAAIFSICSATAHAVDLKPDAIEAFNQFIATVETRLEPRFRGQSFLWIDEAPGTREQLLSGSVIAKPVQGNGIVPLKGALAQDWNGAIFIPRTNLPDVLSIVQGYDRHSDIYKPDISESRIESRHGDDYLVFMRVVKAKFMLSAVFSTENEIQFTRLDAKRVYSRAYSKRINEVASPGQSSEHELPSGHDRGLLWRLYGYWFFEERDNGVYIACESITMTRDVPFGMGTLLGPIVNDMPGESLRKSLEQTRRAVTALHPH